jgi:endonuclease/exonuclease/phosphatase family metal-dependent hydrolase
MNLLHSQSDRSTPSSRCAAADASPRRRFIARIAGALMIIACAFFAAGMAPRGAPPRITVMTWNIYFGGGNIGDEPDFGDFFESVQATDFHQRAARIARIVDQQNPHIICLQEVARWETENLIGQEEDDIDFLPILQTRLLARGLHYDIVGSLDTIEFEAPGEVDDDLLNIKWTERIVMLARHSNQLQVGTVRLRRFDDTFSIDIPAVGDLEFERGWIAADITFRGEHARYVCTHLEALSSSVRAAQAEQLIEWLSGTNLPVIVMGDMNSLPPTSVYQQFTDAGYTDVWAVNHGLFEGPTCCQEGDLLNDDSHLATRIDQIFTRGAITPISSNRAGHKQADRSPGGLWPSDHAAVVAKLRLD